MRLRPPHEGDQRDPGGIESERWEERIDENAEAELVRKDSA